MKCTVLVLVNRKKDVNADVLLSIITYLFVILDFFLLTHSFFSLLSLVCGVL